MSAGIKSNQTAVRPVRSHVESFPRLPDPTTVQIETREEAWLLTQWINPGITIRLRIHHSWYRVEPDELVCEVSESRRGYEFQEVARLLWHPDDDLTIREWPVQWRESFRQLANLWLVLVTVAEWGLALGREPIRADVVHALRLEAVGALASDSSDALAVAVGASHG